MPMRRDTIKYVYPSGLPHTIFGWSRVWRADMLFPSGLQPASFGWLKAKAWRATKHTFLQTGSKVVRIYQGWLKAMDRCCWVAWIYSLQLCLNWLADMVTDNELRCVDEAVFVVVEYFVAQISDTSSLSEAFFRVSLTHQNTKAWEFYNPTSPCIDRCLWL